MNGLNIENSNAKLYTDVMSTDSPSLKAQHKANGISIASDWFSPHESKLGNATATGSTFKSFFEAIPNSEQSSLTLDWIYKLGSHIQQMYREWRGIGFTPAKLNVPMQDEMPGIGVDFKRGMKKACVLPVPMDVITKLKFDNSGDYGFLKYEQDAIQGGFGSAMKNGAICIINNILLIADEYVPWVNNFTTGGVNPHLMISSVLGANAISFANKTTQRQMMVRNNRTRTYRTMDIKTRYRVMAKELPNGRNYVLKSESDLRRRR